MPAKRLPAPRQAVFSMKKLLIIIFLISIIGVNAQVVTQQKILKNQNSDSIFNNQYSNNIKTPICPYCKKNEFVIRISTDTNRITHLHIANKNSERKYFKKKEKQGYDTDWEIIWPDLLHEQEFLIWIDIKGEKEKFMDPKYHWFCKKCKKIF